MADLMQRELAAIVGAHLLAVIPIGALMLAGRLSPLHEVPSRRLARWWAWFALVIVVTAIVGAAASQA